MNANADDKHRHFCEGCGAEVSPKRVIDLCYACWMLAWLEGTATVELGGDA